MRHFALDDKCNSLNSPDLTKNKCCAIPEACCKIMSLKPTIQTTVQLVKTISRISTKRTQDEFGIITHVY